MRAWKSLNQEQKRRWMNLLENLFLVALFFYPLRHIGEGIDFRDTGYNYANFQYMGTEHMDSMWLFSTYLANALGNLLMGLPKADTMMGMNLYTGLFVSLLALAGYFFCTRKLKMPKALTFLGEMMAVSLCWCPTALLYNYLTYVLFLGAFILLYCGLCMESGPAITPGYSMEVRYFVMEKHFKKQGRYLAGAGALLGANVLVRFSNLAEAAMIAAVWAYDVILWLEGRKLVLMKKAGKESDAVREAAFITGEGFWHRLGRHTLWCLAGYAAALGALLGYMHLKYGLGEYIAGIRRLFAMTETAVDYKAESMLTGMLWDYRENLYWVLRIGIIAAAGILLFFLTDKLEAWIRRRSGAINETGEEEAEPRSGARLPMEAGSRSGARLPKEAGPKSSASLPKETEPKAAKFLHVTVRLFWAAVCAAMLGWLYYRGFCSLLFYSYDPIRRPCILFLMLAMLIGAIRIFQRSCPREEKLLSGMVILVILLTSIGSNNKTFPSWNNLFVAAPYTFWESWKFIRGGEKKAAVLFPIKAVLLAFLGMCLFQSAGFGATFVFAESTGVRNADSYVENNEVLKNIRMPEDRARLLTELSAYVKENGLQGKEVILYGEIPALSYYLQMPSAFNPWSDLRSYGLEIMEKDMAELEEEMAEGKSEKPVIILENTHALYVEGGPEALAAAGVKSEAIENDGKWKLIVEFMEKYGYGQVLRNEKFAIYR